MFDYNRAIAPKVHQVKPSGIRKYFGIAENHAPRHLPGGGRARFSSPPGTSLQAGIDSLLQGKTQYTANAGLMELRREISAYLERRFSLPYHPEDQVPDHGGRI